jgi:hypothetical protein
MTAPHKLEPPFDQQFQGESDKFREGWHLHRRGYPVSALASAAAQRGWWCRQVYAERHCPTCPPFNQPNAKRCATCPRPLTPSRAHQTAEAAST